MATPPIARHPARDRLRGFVAAHRDNLVFRAVARAADKYLRAYNNESNWAFRYNGEENALREILCLYEGCVFDVGANVGHWTRMARQLDAKRPIHAFEISPSTFRTLASNLSGLSGCVLNNIGLSDREGELNLQYYPSSPDNLH
jgi:hypothetical protein